MPSARRRIPLLLLAALLLGGAPGCAAPRATAAGSAAGTTGTAVEPADLLLWRGKLTTLDPERPAATALAARDGVIVAVGSDAELAAYRGPATRVVDLEGRTAIPGFIEAHGHFIGIGRALMNVDLRSARSWDEVVQRVAAAARERPAGEWLLGWGWHQEKWERPPQPAVEGYPTHAALSRAVPDHPVLLKHAAGSHGGMANAYALREAGIDAATPDPAGGTLLRDAGGQPTGMLRENAYDLVLAAQERAERGLDADELRERQRREIALADAECLSKGITSFQDAGSSFEEIDRLRQVARDGELGVRLWVMIRESNAELERRLADYSIAGESGEHLTVRAIKRSLDGALGTHGAWLLEDYSDLPGRRGLNTIPPAELEATARLARQHDFQLAVHAIGDRANRETLDIFERVLAGEGPRRRWRIEHAQHLHPADVPRFAELGVIASMQGIHCTSDGPWVPLRIGAERAANGAYVWRKLLDAGVVVANGTDAPVEDVDPLANFHATVTRQLADGSAFYPDQRMTRLEALAAATRDAAYAAFEESRKGSLTPGKLADVVVLSQDLLAVPPERLLETRVLLTVVGGEVKYRAAEPW